MQKMHWRVWISTMKVGADLVVLQGSFNHQNQRMLGKQTLLAWSHNSMNLRKWIQNSRLKQNSSSCWFHWCQCQPRFGLMTCSALRISSHCIEMLNIWSQRAATKLALNWRLDLQWRSGNSNDLLGEHVSSIMNFMFMTILEVWNLPPSAGFLKTSDLWILIVILN